MIQPLLLWVDAQKRSRRSFRNRKKSKMVVSLKKMMKSEHNQIINNKYFFNN